MTESPSSSAPPVTPGAFRSRVLPSLWLVTAFGGLCAADLLGLGGAPPSAWLLPLATAVGIGATIEAAGLTARIGVVPRRPLVAAAIGGMVVATAWAAGGWTATEPPTAWAGLGAAGVACSVGVACLFAAELPVYRGGGGTVPRIAAGALVIVAVGMPLAFMVGLRLLRDAAGGICLVPLVSMIAVVKGSDVAAYLVGSRFGRHKMAPTVSPGKTWEGAAAGLAAAAGVACVALAWQPEGSRPLGGAVGYGLAVGAAGMLGDLAESLVKRDLGVKDSGHSLGGLGGVLDLVDALLVAAPVAWLFWVAGGLR